VVRVGFVGKIKALFLGNAFILDEMFVL